MVRNPFFWEPSDASSSQQKDLRGVLRMLHYISVFPHAFMVQYLIQHRVSLPPLPNIIGPSVAVVIGKCHLNSVAEYDILKYCHTVNQQMHTMVGRVITVNNTTRSF